MADIISQHNEFMFDKVNKLETNVPLWKVALVGSLHVSEPTARVYWKTANRLGLNHERIDTNKDKDAWGLFSGWEEC